jgi:hypothetical protein
MLHPVPGRVAPVPEVRDMTTTTPWKHIDVEHRGDVACVRFKRFRIDEPEIPTLASELITLGTAPGCHKVALSLGPRPPEFLYSVFLAKLMTVQRRLAENDCSLVLCEAGPEVQAIFNVCHLDHHFHFVPDFDAAVEMMAK